MRGFDNDKERADFYLEILEAYEGTILVLDESGHIIYANQYAIDRILMPKEDFLSQTIYELEAGGYILNSSTQKVLSSRRKEITFITGNMRSPLLSVATPVFSAAGDFLMAVSYSLHDDPSSVTIELLENEKIKVLELARLFEAINAEQTIVAKSAQMRELMQMLARVAPADSTVLLTGESGVGKEVFSRYVHQNSSRQDQIFLPINCAAIPEALMESEFFGYVQGAFTGANKQGKPGLFELANNGTLFLDEIGELPLPLQAKLLRTLETGWVTRLGAEKPQKVNVRIITATNKDLKKMVKDRLFREDLYYRLNTIELKIPPVRERREDIEPLANLFLDDYNRKYRTQKVFSLESLSMFRKYAWPGNVREIRNVVERMVIMSPANQRILNDHFIELEDSGNDSERPHNENIPFDLSPFADTDRPLQEFMAEAERQYILAAYSANQNNAAQTAKKLSIDKSGLYKKLKSYGY